LALRISPLDFSAVAVEVAVSFGRVPLVRRYFFAGFIYVISPKIGVASKRGIFGVFLCEILPNLV